MAVIRGKAGIVAISCPGAATDTVGGYDTDSTPTHTLFCDVAESTRQSDFFDKVALADGQEERSGLVEMRRVTGVTVSMPASDTGLPILVAKALGTESVASPSGGTTSKQHNISPASITTELRNFAVQVNQVSTSSTTAVESIKHTGCVCSSFTLSGTKSDPAIRCSATFQSSGTEGTLADLSTGMTVPAYLPYNFNHMYNFLSLTTISSAPTATTDIPVFGTPPDGSNLTTAVNVGNWLESFSWTVNNNLDVDGGHNTGGDTNASTMFRQARSQSVTMTWKWNTTDSIIENMRSSTIGTEYAMGLYCYSNTRIVDEVTDYAYGWKLLFPKLVLRSTTMGGGLGIRTITATFDVAQPSLTVGSAYFYAWNADATIYR